MTINSPCRPAGSWVVSRRNAIVRATETSHGRRQGRHEATVLARTQQGMLLNAQVDRDRTWAAMSFTAANTRQR